MKNCDHIIGQYFIDEEGLTGRLVTYQEEVQLKYCISRANSNYVVFNYCPDCGINIKEIIKTLNL